MIKNKYRKIFIISFILIFVVMFICTSVMANNILHTQHCDKPNCSICIFIGISTQFIKNIILISFGIIILMNLIEFIRLINSNIFKYKKLTLIDLKVIQIK